MSVLLVLCGKIAYINVKVMLFNSGITTAELYQQGYTPFKRGDIKDRNGNVLATSVMVYNLVIDSKINHE